MRTLTRSIVMASGLIVSGVMLCVTPDADAKTRSRAEVAAQVKRTMDALIVHRAKVDEAVDGTVALDRAEAARFRADFSRAVALYEERPDDSAALTALNYVFLFCSDPPSPGDRQPCRKVMPRAQKMMLKYWARNPEAAIGRSGAPDWLSCFQS